MAKNLVNPSLFDISADIAGEIPLDIVRQWASSNQSQSAHEEILKPFIRKGIVVCSDSAGLSKLSAQRPLVEVMKLVSEPKEVIYSFGLAAGGEPVGIWFADNTEMFYPEGVSAEKVLLHMAAAQKEIGRLTVQVGMCVHQGSYVALGRGLYGEADTAEQLAEDYTAGGEIIVTDEIQAALPGEFNKSLRQREDKPLGRNVHVFDHASWSETARTTTESHYPLPFDKDFFVSLQQITRDDKKSLDKVQQKYASNKIVVLVKVFFDEESLLLNKMSQMVLANKTIHAVAGEFDLEKIKSNGQLAIFVCESAAEALDFSTKLKERLSTDAFSVSIGMAAGEVLLFRPEEGMREIAGGPVNIASKMAEDLGKEPGHIYVHSTAIAGGKKIGQPFSVKISGVIVEGVKI